MSGTPASPETRGPGGLPPRPEDPSSPPSPCRAPASLFQRPLARLSAEEIDNAFEDLLADKSRPMPDTEDVGTFGDFKVALVPHNRESLETYVAVIDDVTTRAVAADRRKQWMTCDVAAGTCVGEWLKGFLPRALRTAVSDREVADMVSFYEAERAQLGPEQALRSVLRSIFLAPRFLFHLESGSNEPKEGVIKMTPHELAARLSFFMWRSVPDAKLIEAAQRGLLADKTALGAEVTRMAADPRFRRSLKSFIEQWLGTASLVGVDALKKETTTFFTETVLAQLGVKELLTASYSYLDAESARQYGESGTGRVEFKNSPRSGLLTQGAVLSSFSGVKDRNVIFRGKLVRVKLMCTEFPAPPDNATSMPVDRMAYPSCKGCHGLLDPVGRGLERYSSVGVYRVKDSAGQAIATKGEFTDKNVAFDGAQELGKYLASSEEAHGCMGKTLFTYALRQGMEDCARDRMATLSASGGSIVSIAREIVLSDAFATRALSTPAR